MEKIKFEKQTQESKEKEFDSLLKQSLKSQLKKMIERMPERKDIKFAVLKGFVKELENKTFQQAFASLSDMEKHIIITRLENEAKHLGGEVPYEFIEGLSKKVYGTACYDDPDFGKVEDINFQKKIELEEQIQTKDGNFYLD